MRTEIFKGKSVLRLEDCIDYKNFKFIEAKVIATMDPQPKVMVRITDNKVSQVYIDVANIGYLYNSNIDPNLCREYESCIFNEILAAIKEAQDIKEKDFLYSSVVLGDFNYKKTGNYRTIIKEYFATSEKTKDTIEFDSKTWKEVLSNDETTTNFEPASLFSAEKAYIDSYKMNFFKDFFDIENKETDFQKVFLNENTGELSYIKDNVCIKKIKL